jgi:hypothetical protein
MSPVDLVDAYADIIARDRRALVLALEALTFCRPLAMESGPARERHKRALSAVKAALGLPEPPS